MYHNLLFSFSYGFPQLDLGTFLGFAYYSEIARSSQNPKSLKQTNKQKTLNPLYHHSITFSYSLFCGRNMLSQHTAYYGNVPTCFSKYPALPDFLSSSFHKDV